MEENVGHLFTRDGKDAWRLVSFCSDPTVSFENLETKERVGGSLFSQNARQFTRLVKESTNDQ